MTNNHFSFYYLPIVSLPHVSGHCGNVLDKDLVAIPSRAFGALAQVEDFVAADVNVGGRWVRSDNL